MVLFCVLNRPKLYKWLPVFFYFSCRCFYPYRLYSHKAVLYIKKEQDGIFIGVDTRTVTYKYDESTRSSVQSYLSICKMDQVNNIILR
jgi:hypothetical protein